MVSGGRVLARWGSELAWGDSGVMVSVVVTGVMVQEEENLVFGVIDVMEYPGDAEDALLLGRCPMAVADEVSTKERKRKRKARRR